MPLNAPSVDAILVAFALGVEPEFGFPDELLPEEVLPVEVLLGVVLVCEDVVLCNRALISEMRSQTVYYENARLPALVHT